MFRRVLLLLAVACFIGAVSLGQDQPRQSRHHRAWLCPTHNYTMTLLQRDREEQLRAAEELRRRSVAWQVSVAAVFSSVRTEQHLSQETEMSYDPDEGTFFDPKADAPPPAPTAPAPPPKADKSSSSSNNKAEPCADGPAQVSTATTNSAVPGSK